MYQLSIVVPTYNEAGNVQPLLRLLAEALVNISYEVIFVDDDSPDGTADRVRAIAQTNPAVRVLHRVGRNGLSSACVEGMMAAAAPYVAVMDADLQHDEKILPAMLELMQREHLDIVIGSRHASGGSMGAFAKERVALSQFGRRISQFVCKADVSDPMSGFFLVNRNFLHEVIYDLSSIGFKILVDLLASARRPVRIGEVPYTFRNRQEGESKLDTLVLLEYLQLVADKLTGGLIPARFLLFSAVGFSGVLVHALVLASLYRSLEWEFRPAYLIALLLAMTCNFFFNNLVTYRECRLKGARALALGWLSFCLACSLGAFISIQIADSLRLSGVHWALASLVGIALASVWNYTMTQTLTWRLRRRARNRRRQQHLQNLRSVQTVS
ncbi:glycosyltransferase family 2 protein [Oscillatoria amoena NRMC-F 0135]|nr:glycosyltransferase family 2 protein [Oscillatoria amoena NRMC-F 0135]